MKISKKYINEIRDTKQKQVRSNEIIKKDEKAIQDQKGSFQASR